MQVFEKYSSHNVPHTSINALIWKKKIPAYGTILVSVKYFWKAITLEENTEGPLHMPEVKNVTILILDVNKKIKTELCLFMFLYSITNTDNSLNCRRSRDYDLVKIACRISGDLLLQGDVYHPKVFFLHSETFNFTGNTFNYCWGIRCVHWCKKQDTWLHLPRGRVKRQSWQVGGVVATPPVQQNRRICT